MKVKWCLWVLLQYSDSNPARPNVPTPISTPIAWHLVGTAPCRSCSGYLCRGCQGQPKIIQVKWTVAFRYSECAQTTILWARLAIFCQFLHILSLIGNFPGMPAYHFLPQHTAPPILVVRLHLQVSRAQRDPMALEIFLSTTPWRKISSCTILHFNSRMSTLQLNRDKHQNLSSESYRETQHPKPLPPGTPPWATQKLKDTTAEAVWGCQLDLFEIQT